MPKGREDRVEIAKALDMLGSNAGRRTRVRRGLVVVVPEEWAGVVTRPQTILKRQSKSSRKSRMRHGGSYDWGRDSGRMDMERQERVAAKIGETVVRGKTNPGHPRNWPERLTPHKWRERNGE